MRCLARFDWGVSPVRDSIVIGRDISVTGLIKLRSMSVAKAFNGEMYSVCMPSWSGAARSNKDGKKPDKVLPDPVGAIRSDE